MKIRKAIATFSAITLVLLYSVVPVYAVERKASNENTGADSINSATTSTTNSTTVSNENTAKVTNNVSSDANTGGNTASYNTGSGSVKTGDASTSVSVSTTVNTNTTDVSCGGCTGPGDTTVQNKNTGANSENTVSAETSNTVAVNNSNDATVKNKLSADSNSGDNKANYNTGNASVTTGDAEANVDVKTDVNHNETTIGGGAGSGGTLTLGNQSTGANSVNVVAASMANGVMVNNHNDADLSTTVDAYAYTGDNKANYNTGNASVKTGNATIDDVYVDQSANSNKTTVGGGSGGSFDVTIENMNTGYNSYNEASLDLANNVTVTNHNDADVNNDLYADSDTGGNQANYNVGDGTVKTGDAKTNVTVLGDFNSSETTLDCNSCLAVGDVTVRNKNTGAKSDNMADFAMENKTKVMNFNHTDVDNEVDAYAYTGDNKANYNGNGGMDASVTTGDADASVTVDDKANSNKTEFSAGSVSGLDVTAENMNTGYNSYNEANVGGKDGIENKLFVLNVNGAHVGNDLYADSDTGSNKANYNVGDGMVDTGDAKTGVSASSDLNKNTTDVECPVCGTGAVLVARNKNTGADSENVAGIDMESSFWAGNFSHAGVSDKGTAYAYTGENSANYNVGAGSVKTGDGDADVSVDTTANVNDTNTPSGSGSNTQTAENTNTGANSVNTVDTSWDTLMKVKNKNNLKHSSTLYADSETGGSSSNYNVGSGSVDSGTAVAGTSDFTSGNIDM